MKGVLQCRDDFGLIAVARRGIIRAAAQDVILAERARQAAEAQAQLLYAENLECRREYLLRHFGEDFSSPCSNCDNCEGQGTARAELIAETRKQADCTA